MAETSRTEAATVHTAPVKSPIVAKKSHTEDKTFDIEAVETNMAAVTTHMHPFEPAH